MSSISKARGMLGFALGALMAAVGPGVLAAYLTKPGAHHAGRKTVRKRFAKASRTSKASKRSGRTKPMIWVGGQWIFFRP